VADITGSGTSNEMNHYEILDSAPLFGRSYYRLKQTDFDGKTTYSKIESVLVDAERVHSHVYPNPNSGHQVFVQLKSDWPLEEISILDISSLVVFESKKVIPTQDGTYEFIFVKPLPAGIYIVKISYKGFTERVRLCVH